MGFNTYAAVRAETTSRGLEVRPANSPPVTNIIRVSRNHQQLHKELLFTHRKVANLQVVQKQFVLEEDSCNTLYPSGNLLQPLGPTLRSKPELLQVLEHRNRRREGIENRVELSPLEQQLQRWQQRREQRQQQEEQADTMDHQPEFIRVRGNLRRIQHSLDVPSLHAKPSLARPPLANAEFSQVRASPSPEVPDGDGLLLRGSSEASSVSSAPSQCSLPNS